MHWQQGYKTSHDALLALTAVLLLACCVQVTTSKEKKGPRAKELKAKEVLQANFKVGASRRLGN
jgi:hypothetical protein